MSEDRWRARLRWVVAHPRDPQVLLARRDGALVLPETERLGRVWTADRGRGPPGPARAARRRRPAAGLPGRPRGPGGPGAAGGQGAGRLPVLRLDRRLRGPPVPGPGHDPARHRLYRPHPEDELRQRLRQAYLPVWAAFEPPGRLERVWELATPLGALDQAVSYRSLATQPPMDPHMAQATAWWLRQVLAGLG